MSELGEKVRKSIERLKLFEPEDGYYLAFSGGKDSVTCNALLDMAGVKYDATYRVTSVDPPELVRFIKDVHPDVKREVPRYSNNSRYVKFRGKPITMWNLIPLKLMPPTRLARYCCERLKESGGDGRVTVTGVRWAESVNRKKNQGAVVIQGDFKDDNLDGQESLFDAEQDEFEVNERHGSLILTNDNEDNRRIVENCFRRRKTTVNPIIEWTDADVWDFIHTHTQFRIAPCTTKAINASAVSAAQWQARSAGLPISPGGQSMNGITGLLFGRCLKSGANVPGMTQRNTFGKQKAKTTQTPQLKTFGAGGWNSIEGAANEP